MKTTKEQLKHFLATSTRLFWEDVQKHGLTDIHREVIDEESLKAGYGSDIEVDPYILELQMQVMDSYDDE